MPAPPKLRLRRATRGDLEEVAALWHESASLMDGAARDVPAREALRRRIDSELRSGWDLHVAVAGEHVVGMLAIRPDQRLLDQIFVAPGAQGKGVGGALLQVAKSSMPEGFSLRMDASNERARHFYEKRGMKLVEKGVHPHTGIPVHFYGWKIH